MQSDQEYRTLFHKLNNQLGVVLANAELLEARCTDQASRARASQVVAGVIEAIGTAHQLRTLVEQAASDEILTDRPPTDASRS
jgi:hypothetical protein